MSIVPPARLFHYTDQNGLLGIIRTKTIWATDSQYLNDPLELHYGYGLMVSSLDRIASEVHPTACQTQSTFEDGTFSLATKLRVASQALQGKEVFSQNRTPETYVAAFSAVGDSLGQWRGYGGNGGGFALEFESSGLERASLATDGGEPEAAAWLPVNGPLEVHYGPHDCAAAADKLVHEVIKRGPPNHPTPAGVAMAYNDCVRAIALMKDDAYREEREYRLIIQSPIEGYPGANTQVNFRPGPLAPVPFVRIGFARDSLTAVRVGPGGNVGLKADSCRRLLDRFNLPQVRIDLSTVPYRV